MNLAEYATYDALGLAELVAKKQVSPKELAQTAVAAKEKVDPTVKSVVELYPDRIEGLDEKTLGQGPFRGVPFLIKDVFGHEKGRKIEFGSRLCEGMTVEVGTYFADLLKASGVNILGRSAAPEYSMAATTESVDVRQHVEPLEAGLLGGRLDRRRAGGGGRRHRAHRARLRHRRLDPHPRQLVRRRRAQALAHARLVGSGGGRGRLGLLDEFRADQDRARRGGHARLRVDPAARRSLHHPEARRALRLARQEAGAEAQDRHRAGRAGRHEGGPGGCRAPSRRRARRWPAWATRWSGRASTWAGGTRSSAAFDIFFFGFDCPPRRLRQAQRPQGRARTRWSP